MPEPTRAADGLRAAGKSLGALLLLSLATPLSVAFALAGVARRRPPAAPAVRLRTVLVSGGKMTKALQLARAFWRAGHRVVLVETEKYWLTGHRFSRAVSRFYTTPRPEQDYAAYLNRLVEIVRREGVDAFVPVTSPAASYYEALAKQELSKYCEVIHVDAETCRTVDDKYAFSEAARRAGLPVPEAHRITDPAQIAAFDFASSDHQFILKSIPYDAVRRLDLTRLPRPTPAETEAFARRLPIGEDRPWIMQAFVPGREYCTHSTVRDGRVRAHVCCASSPFQVNYAAVDHPRIRAWVERFVAALGATGQLSFDFIETPDGTVRAIECNPRTHSAITTFHDHPSLAAAYLDADGPPVTPLPGSRPTYWLYHEAWRLLAGQRPLRAFWRVLREGKEALLDPDDVLPFLMVYHFHLPLLLWQNLLRGKPWERIDFNIGKLVEAGGD